MIHRRLCAFCFAFVVAALATVIDAPAPAEAKPVACSVTAHIRDPDPKGALIRRAPRHGAAVLARIRPKRAGGKEIPRIVHISGQSGAWLRVTSVRASGRRVFSGAGWIHNSLVWVTINNAVPLRSAPSVKARVIGNTGDVEATSRVFACRGGWVRVRHVDLGKEGWLPHTGYCAGRDFCR
jgi:hypothetical protein